MKTPMKSLLGRPVDAVALVDGPMTALLDAMTSLPVHRVEPVDRRTY